MLEMEEQCSYNLYSTVSNGFVFLLFFSYLRAFCSFHFNWIAGILTINFNPLQELLQGAPWRGRRFTNIKLLKLIPLVKEGQMRVRKNTLQCIF